jgi:hypothetical protein
MADRKVWIGIPVVKKNLHLVLDSIKTRIEESEEFLQTNDLNDEDYRYHEGRKEALEITERQIHRLFEDVLQA